MKIKLRINSTVSKHLGNEGVKFIEHCCGAIEIILPHVKVSKLEEVAWTKTNCVSASPERTEIRLTLAIGHQGAKPDKSLKIIVQRQGSENPTGSTLHPSEFSICKLIIFRISKLLEQRILHTDKPSMRAIIDTFDEYIVAQYIHEHLALNKVIVANIFDALHTLAKQSYENKALSFGCILDSKKSDTETPSEFLDELLNSKKYKALSDGFRTAYHITANGKIIGFIDLEKFGKKKKGEHFYPDWAEPIATSSHTGRCGIALSRQGDILVFYDGTLRFTYRFGKWHYWNHSYLVELLSHQARAQRVPRKIRGRVVGAIYKASLDISFRRSGGLFALLRSRDLLSKVVRKGDSVGDPKRRLIDKEFDSVIDQKTLQYLPRRIVVELASLDGAIVLRNSGDILAYGAVLQPRKMGKHLRGTEGSRTKAAIGASNYGLAVKISSDGDITAYHQGEAIINI